MLQGMYSSATFLPSPETAVLDSAAPELDSFAAFLEKLTQLDISDVPVEQPPAVQDDDADSLSYEHALRRRPVAVPASLTVQELASTGLAVAERRSARTTLRLTVQERDLLQQRAVESSLSVSAYVRSCVFEVEMLRAQVKQLVAETRTNAVAQPSVIADETPVIAAPPKQAALPSPTQTRQLKPAVTRKPQSALPRHTDPRVQAALDEQRRLSTQQAAQKHSHKKEAKPGLFGFFFGARRSA